MAKSGDNINEILGVKALMFFFLLFQPSQRFDWDSLSKVKPLDKPNGAGA